MAVINNKIENISALTPMQEGMLFHSQLSKKSSAYVIQIVLNVEKTLRPDIIKSALDLLSRKYSVIRTFFVSEKVENPCQVVLRERIPEFTEYDFSGKDDSEKETAINEIIDKDVARGFDLQKDTLLRVKYVRLSDNENKLIFTNHHIIFDGWCSNIVIDKFFEIYLRLENGEKFDVIADEIRNSNENELGYTDYLTWLSKKDKNVARKYWEKNLENYDCNSIIQPVSKPEPTDEQVVVTSITISEEKSRKIDETVKQNNITLSLYYETVLGLTLSTYTRSNDVVFGKVVSGRNAPLNGIEDMVGLFINTIPVRLKYDDEMTVSGLLHLQEKLSEESSNYDYCSLAELQSMTPQGKDLIKVLYVFENYNSGVEEEKKIYSFEKSREQTNYDLSVSGYEMDGKHTLEIMYDPNNYCDKDIRSILERFRKISEEMADKPDSKVSELETVTEEEKQLILSDFNATETDYPRDKTVVELFEEQVKKTPDNIALVFEDKKLTYAELNARANSLGHKLREMGVKPDDFVAIIADRSIEMIAGIYGIIKSGGAYVPIDPTYPEDKIRFIINDCAPKAILKFTTENVDIDKDIPVIDLSENEIWSGNSDDLALVNKTTDLIYCIYTSGTTGKSKGVLIEQKNLTAYVSQFVDYYKINADTVILQQAYVGFDTSIEELYPGLISGGKMVIVDKEHLMDSEKMKKTIINEKINIISCSPLLIKEMDYLRETEMKTLISGGDVLKREYFEGIKDTNIGVYNTYGPTEATVCATYYKVNFDDENTNIPIGKPIANSKVYILNGSTMCGIGVPGELCIAGDGLARGYLNRPDLTAEKFVKNPFGEGRMYRSGDLARWLPDGNIEYLGRIDEQVKIRGFRIELGEIESRIREIENIKDCAVIAKADSTGDKAIYAYYTSDIEIGVPDVRDKLAETLPEYMVPAYMMQIEAIPVTRNGKLDKRSLPEIEAKATKEYIAPRNEIEEKICSIFSEILNVEQVGVKDSFFELGGHSLRATRLVNRIEAETGVRIALKEVFAHPTAEQLAVLAGGESEEYVPIPKAEEKEYYPMSSAQKRTYLIQQMQPEAVTYNMPTNLKLTGEVKAEALKNALQAMTDRHEILRTVFLMVDGEPVQKILDHVEADFEYVTSNESDEKLMKEFLKPFDLASGKLVRIKLANKGEYHLMMIDMHHIIGDGMSMNTFTNEFMALYNGEKLEPLTHQFKDYSEWMRSRDLSGQEEYWKSQFDDEIPVLDMPTDFPRPQEQSYAGTMLGYQFNEELSSGIKKLVKKTGATEYMIFLAAAMVTLSKYSRQEDIVIGSPISGRTHRDTEGMLGMFVNTLAMRGKPEKNKTFSQFLEEIRNTCLKAYENQEYPFEELVEAVDVQRDMSRNPLFDVMLAVQNNEETKFMLGNCEAEEIIENGSIAKFDMTFNITDDDGKFGIIDDTNSKFDITFNIADYNGKFGIILEYCTDLFKAETADEILKHFEEVLKSVTEYADQKLGEIEMVTVDEKQLILNDFNATEVDYPKDKTVVELFEEQVKKTPDNIALIFEDQKLTYAELNARANSLAHKLREMGVKPDDFVAIIADRSIEMIAGIYGIIKAGGAYVPIDPTYPEDRINYMIEDCGAKALLLSTSEIIDIDTDIPAIDLRESDIWEGNAVDPEHINTSGNALYCIYTSGTTGKPKGVIIEHNGITNLGQYMQNELEVTGDDRVLMFANYIFDGSVWEISMAHLNGAALYIPTDETIKDISKMEKYVAENNITVSYFPPAYFEQGELGLSRYVVTADRLSNVKG